MGWASSKDVSIQDKSFFVSVSEGRGSHQKNVLANTLPSSEREIFLAACVDRGSPFKSGMYWRDGQALAFL